MKPGRELDSLIAEKVMGLHLSKRRDEWGDGDSFFTQHFHEDGDQTIQPVKHYSTAIADAWDVIEKLISGPFPNIAIARNGYGKWSVLESADDYAQELSESEAAPHAICLAALAAAGTS